LVLNASAVATCMLRTDLCVWHRLACAL